jgi:hypothetical protein
MVNSKKMNKSSVAIVLLALLLVLSLVLTATGAWFTDKEEGTDVELTFGHIDINVDATAFGTVTAGGEYLEGVDIMPGDKVSYALSVDGKATSESFWFAVIVTSEGLATNMEDGLASLEAKNVYSWERGAAATEVKGEVTLDGATYDNNYQGKTVTFSYYVVAVQKANVASAEAAVEYLKAAQPYIAA